MSRIKSLFLVLLCALPLSLFGRVVTYPGEFEGVAKSDRYRVSVGAKGGAKSPLVVFKNSCNEYDPNGVGVRKNDDVPLLKFRGQTIHWCNFSFDESVEVEVEIPEGHEASEVAILPSRRGVKVERVGARRVRFTLSEAGQYSVEIGADGYKNGLLIFANPLEQDIPRTNSSWCRLSSATKQSLEQVSYRKKRLYFEAGVHDIGVYEVPSNIKEIYIEGGAWVYGALIMRGHADSNVKIYGRGTLSGARLHLRESHIIEAVGGANNISVEGVSISDYVYYAIRLLGRGSRIDWTKIVGGWIFNCDGVALYGNSSISNSFIWANDDNIKIYDDNVRVENIVCWQLDNGAIFQLNWGRMTAHNCTIRGVDILHAEWNSDRENNGVISCRTSGGANSNFLFEDITIERPVSHILRLSPQGDTEHPIENFVLRNWSVKLKSGWRNYIVGATPSSPISGLVFDNVVINGERVSEANFPELGNFVVENCEPIIFK